MTCDTTPQHTTQQTSLARAHCGLASSLDVAAPCAASRGAAATTAAAARLRLLRRVVPHLVQQPHSNPADLQV